MADAFLETDMRKEMKENIPKEHDIQGKTEGEHLCLSMAPMEGITGHVYRRTHHQVFGQLDRYYMPFLTNPGFSRKELREILPENNRGMEVIPQILTNQSEVFLTLVQALEERGYQEVNLNIGCPSGTVTAKNRGSGFLRDLEGLDRFLQEIFEKSPLPISVKTRVGFAREEEWPAIWELLGRYPFRECIIHPRLREDFYRGSVRMPLFVYACQEEEKKGHPLDSICYNGDIRSLESYQQIQKENPKIHHMMLGRGLIANPGLAGEIRGQGRMKRDQLETFLFILTEEYQKEMQEERNVLWKLLEMWSYLKTSFPEGEKIGKRVRKCRNLSEYRGIVQEALKEYE